MTRALVTSSKYSPGNMTPEALDALFVGREKTLNDVLKRLAASAMGREKHYILLIGPRGVGKTHFVALLHHRLTTESAYETARGRLRIAYLNEEELGVASFLDFLVRILRALASGDPGLETKIERIYTTHEKDPSLALEVAQSILIEHVGERTLLLLCENLADLFEGLGDEGQKRWRAFVQEHPFWTILATTPAMFAGVKLQSEPFYGFFTVRYLEKLDFETSLALLRKKADVEKRPNLAAALSTPTGRARVRAIHHLAGGHHRVYVTMFEFLDRESLDDLVTPFLRMVDDLTPYYQERMRRLAPLQRKITEFLSRQQRPVIVKDIASRCLISPQTAAKQLGELALLGVVRSEKSGRVTYYELAEPLMRICVEVKDNKTQHIGLFVRFLREWFSTRELQARLDEINAIERHVDKLHIEIALRELNVSEEEPLLQALMEECRRCHENADYAGMAEAAARLSEEHGDELYHFYCVSSLRMSGRIEDANMRLNIALGKYPQSHVLADEHAHLLFLAGNNNDALEEIDRAIMLQPDCHVSRDLRGEILVKLNRYEDAVANDDVSLRRNADDGRALQRKAWVLLELNRNIEAETAARTLVKDKAHAGYARYLICCALFQQGKFKDALTSIRRAIRHDPKNIRYLCLQGSILGALHEHEAVLANEDLLLSVDPTHSHAIYTKGMALLRLKRFVEAERVAQEFAEKEPRDANGFLLMCLTMTGARGFSAGVEHFMSAFAAEKCIDMGSADRDFKPSGVIAEMMLVEANARGPLTMADQVVLARRPDGNYDLDALFADSLMRLLRNLVANKLLQAEAWDRALPALSAALHDIPDCEVPLRMLSAAVRYSRSHSEADMLDLPLEQRTLLLDAFAESGAQAASAPGGIA